MPILAISAETRLHLQDNFCLDGKNLDENRKLYKTENMDKFLLENEDSMQPKWKNIFIISNNNSEDDN